MEAHADFETREVNQIPLSPDLLYMKGLVSNFTGDFRDYKRGEQCPYTWEQIEDMLEQADCLVDGQVPIFRIGEVDGVKCIVIDFPEGHFHADSQQMLNMSLGQSCYGFFAFYDVPVRVFHGRKEEVHQSIGSVGRALLKAVGRLEEN